jgi:hypothetical protein
MFTKVPYFSKTYHHSKYQEPTSRGTSVLISGVHIVAILVLLTAGNEQVQM